MCVNSYRGYVKANGWQTTLSGWTDCANPLSPWARGCPTGDTQAVDPWLTLASCRQTLTASSTDQEAGNMSDFKSNKVTDTTCPSQSRRHWERQGLVCVCVWGGLRGVIMKIAEHPATPRLQSQTGPSICVNFKEQNVTEQWTCSRRISNRVRCKVTPKPDRFLKTDAVVNGSDTHATALKLWLKFLTNLLLAINVYMHSLSL